MVRVNCYTVPIPRRCLSRIQCFLSYQSPCIGGCHISVDEKCTTTSGIENSNFYTQTTAEYHKQHGSRYIGYHTNTVMIAFWSVSSTRVTVSLEETSEALGRLGPKVVRVPEMLNSMRKSLFTLMLDLNAS